MVGFSLENAFNINKILKNKGYSTNLYTPNKSQKYNVDSESILIIIDAVDKNYEAFFNTYITLTNGFDTHTLPPILALINASSPYIEKLFTLGVLDYISYPIIPAEVNYRVNCALNVMNFSSYCQSNLPSGEQVFTYQHSLQNSTSNAILAEKAVNYLYSHLDEEIKLNDLTSKMATNRNKLAKVFKDYLGMPIFSWLREQRLLKAAGLLESTSMSILQIAEQVGYTDPNNFATAFKKKFKQSPLQYRKHNPFIKHNSNTLLPTHDDNVNLGYQKNKI